MSLSNIKKHFSPKSILDIGANKGQFYHETKAIFPDCYFYLIEGNPECEVSIKSLNVDHKIELLSNEVKLVDFFVRDQEPTCTGNSIYKENTDFYKDGSYVTKKLKTNTLDLIFKDESFDLIKIDVQGSELDIIKGGLNIIKKAKGLLLEVSLSEFNIGAPCKDEVVSFLETINFFPVEKLADINHPIFHTLIQQDVLFLNKNL